MRPFFALLLFGLVGCATAGVKVDPAKLATFQSGKTTYDEVIAALGPPSSEVRASNGTRVVVYSYVQASARPESFIPLVGPFVGGADARSSSVVLRFGADGTLASQASASSQTGVSNGFASGAVAPERVPQPR